VFVCVCLFVCQTKKRASQLKFYAVKSKSTLKLKPQRTKGECVPNIVYSCFTFLSVLLFFCNTYRQKQPHLRTHTQQALYTCVCVCWFSFNIRCSFIVARSLCSRVSFSTITVNNNFNLIHHNRENATVRGHLIGQSPAFECFPLSSHIP